MGKMCFSSPIGTLELTSEDGFLIGISQNDDLYRENEVFDEVLLEAKKQLSEYFCGTRRTFSLPIRYKGGFLGSVLDAIRTVPYGETISYAALAAKVGSPRAYRSVGTACGKNPLLIVVPCHRITASHSLGGFALDLSIKRFLLALERGVISGQWSVVSGQLGE